MTKLILVDDEKLILDSVNKYLSRFLPEFEVCGRFYNGEDALAYLIDHPIDIVITDICMPDMDGLELSREICNRFPQCITIIISGYSEFEYARTAIKYNVLNYLLKPLDFRELQKCLLEAKGLSETKKLSPLPRADLQEEATELFFVDLFMGIISSVQDLEQRFNALNFPYPLESSEGNLIKIMLMEKDMSAIYHYSIDQLEISLKNILKLSLPDTPIYFVRHSKQEFYYLIISHDNFTPSTRQQLTEAAAELLQLKINVSLHQHFISLNSFIQNKETSRHIPVVGKALTDDSVIQKAIDYIDRNYSQELTRETVADFVFLSPSYFSYQFKKKTGISFFDYLTNVRMQKAIELLGTKMKINDIAINVGYQSRNRFFINFRQYTSYNPTEYRKKILCMEDIPDEAKSNSMES